MGKCVSTSRFNLGFDLGFNLVGIAVNTVIRL